MKYIEIYETINAILELVKKEKIIPLKNTENIDEQIQNLYDKYLDAFITFNPKFKPYRHKPHLIPEMGVNYLLETIKNNKLNIKL